MTDDFYKMASAEFLEQALSTDVDENAVNAIVGSLENQLVKSVPSKHSQNIILNGIPTHLTNISSCGNSIGVQKYNSNQISGNCVVTGIQSSAIGNSSVSFSNVQSSIPSSFATQSLAGVVSNSSAHLKVIYSQPQVLTSNPSRVTFPQHSIANGQILHSVIPQTVNKSVTMQPPLVIKQGTTSGQVGMQSGMVTVPMTVNSSMPGSMPNVMTLNKPGGQNVVVTTQNMGSAQPIMPNVQILNMRPGAPTVAAQKSVATVSPRVVIGAPQVVGARAAAPGITLQTLQSLQPGQQGHLLLKTETGQYQLLRVGPAPAASTITAPQAQTIRLSTVPAHPGVHTVSTSLPAPGVMPGQLPQVQLPPPQQQQPQPPPVVANMSSATPPPQPQPQPPTVTTQKPNDNTKEKCRNFLANLLDLSSKEPKSVEKNVRSLIQELIDAQVEPEEFCDRLERLLNASPQPCLIGFLKRSLPLLRQSLVTKELVIEGINPPAPHVAFSMIPTPTQPIMATSNVQMLCDEGDESHIFAPLPPSIIPVSIGVPLMSPNHYSAVSVQSAMQLRDEDASSPTLTPLLPPVMPVSMPVPSPKPLNVMPMQTAPPVQQRPVSKSGSNIAVLQNIPVNTKINVSKVSSGKSMAANSKQNYSRSAPNAALSTVLTPGKSLLREKEKKAAMQYSNAQPYVDDKMAGDDDINDVAAMGGVNLAEETQRILGSTELIGTQIRSCKDEYLMPLGLLQSRLKAVAARHGLDEPSPDVAGILSHAVHERLKSLVEKLAIIAQHRIDLIIKTDGRYEVTQDVKGQLKFLEEVDRADKKKREDSEREMLLRAAKSRSKNEDPEQAKLKAKAKEMQRAELEELRQREANLTALQAIGPRKKPRLEGPSAAGDSAAVGPTHTNSGYTGRSQMALRTRLKRINQRDMVFLLEQEKDTAHSAMLFRSYLK